MTIADKLFAEFLTLKRVEDEAESLVEQIVEIDDMGYDYYDRSVVLYRDPPLPELTREQVGAILDLGFATMFERRGEVMWRHLRDRSAVVTRPRLDPFRNLPPNLRVPFKGES